MTSPTKQGFACMDVIPDLPLDKLRLNGSASDEEAEGDFRKFIGVRDPLYQVPYEKPWHKVAAVMFAKGASTLREVADICDVDTRTVNNLLRTEWFQKRITDLMLEYGAKDIMTLFKAESVNSLVTLVELRDNEKAPSAVRRASAVDILDRALGKPVQRTENVEVPTSSDPVAEVKRLEEQNSRLRDSLSPTIDATTVAARAVDNG